MDPHYGLQNLELDLDPDPDTTQAEIKWKSKTKDPLPCHVAKIFELYVLGLLLFDILLPGRVGHSVLFRSVRYVLFRSKKERSVLFRFFLEFLATYETQKNVPFFSVLF